MDNIFVVFSSPIVQALDIDCITEIGTDNICGKPIEYPMSSINGAPAYYDTQNRNFCPTFDCIYLCHLSLVVYRRNS